ncbi:MAG: hypothetical protein RR283_09685 [Comamonas sp.]|uniref:hypothetical protein n=1 Tax=unclassified Comamonas TaxID=2638500 RepID=UPI000EAE3E8D|nr:hypothetical protein [Comamonas sp. lk]
MPQNTDRSPTTSSPTSSHAQPPRKSRLVPWLIGLPVVIFAALMLIGTLMDDPQSKQRWVDSEAIKICWKQIGKPEAERKTQEFHSKDDCERLEFDFKSKYGENP